MLGESLQPWLWEPKEYKWARLFWPAKNPVRARFIGARSLARTLGEPDNDASTDSGPLAQVPGLTRDLDSNPRAASKVKSAVYGLNGHRSYYIISLFKVT
jgi:hypothetical protein